MKIILLILWNGFFDFKIKFVEKLRSIFDFLYCRVHNPPDVMSIDDTIDALVADSVSVSRFGDGEAKLVSGRDISFQKADPFAVAKLREVLSSDSDGHLVCLPDVFSSLGYMDASSGTHWKKHTAEFRRVWYSYLVPGKKYGNAFVSRCYMMFTDKSKCAQWFSSLKKLWDGKDILLIEGEKSRLGIGNDLFNNATSIERILGPVENAFSKYDAVLAAAEKHGSGKLILLALGPAATGLAYDLHRRGFHAVDIGHVDIEYEWFRTSAKYKTPVKGKYVNEAGQGRGVGDCADEKYRSEIIENLS